MFVPVAFSITRACTLRHLGPENSKKACRYLQFLESESAVVELTRQRYTFPRITVNKVGKNVNKLLTIANIATQLLKRAIHSYRPDAMPYDTSKIIILYRFIAWFLIIYIINPRFFDCLCIELFKNQLTIHNSLVYIDRTKYFFFLCSYPKPFRECNQFLVFVVQ